MRYFRLCREQYGAGFFALGLQIARAARGTVSVSRMALDQTGFSPQ